MKKIAAICFFLLLFQSVHSITIREINITGNDSSETNTILHYFYENYPGKVWTIEELYSSLVRLQERLVRTGWYKDVEFLNSVSNNEASITLMLREKMPYSFWAGNLYLGISKYNLWGKGKVIKAEIGPVRQKIILEDWMFLNSLFNYSMTVGQEEYFYFTYTTNYTQITAVRQLIQPMIGYVIAPDLNFTLINQDYWLKTTNGLSMDQTYRVGAKLEFDKRAGYPAVQKGYYFSFCSYYLIPQNALQGELFLQFYFPLSEDFVFAIKGHSGYTTASLPEYFQFSLRNNDGLRTLSSFSGLTGNDCWDAHAELRWQFWDPISFLIFDLQLEALAFFDVGEARPTVANFGQPHYVAGGGLRLYLDTFCVRVEAGLDEIFAASILTSFSLPF